MANTPIMDIDTEVLDEIDDDNLVKAIEESRRYQSPMPLIKQELRYTILVRRFSSGKDERIKEEEKSIPEYKLRDEEVMKLYRRREQNRRSSVRCRQKRKEYGNQLEKSISELEEKHHSLQVDIKSLNDEKKHLEKLLKMHFKHCSCKDSRQKQNIMIQNTVVKMQNNVNDLGIPQPAPHKTRNRVITVPQRLMTSKCTPMTSHSRQVNMISLLSVH